MFRIKKYIPILLLASFLPFVIPKEYIHDLFGHEDTQDEYQSSLILEKHHTHCSILQITLSNFLSTSNTVCFKNEPYHSFYIFPESSFIPGISVNLSNLRAPPSIHI